MTISTACWRRLPSALVIALTFGALTRGGGAAAGNPRAFIDTYCITCHNQKLRTAGLALDTVDLTKPAANAEVLEKVIAKLRAGSMPPPKLPRADAATYRAIATELENEIDQASAGHPDP